MFQSQGQDTQNWNIAGGYSQGLILMEFHKINKHETIAKFGAESIEESMVYDIDTKNQKRIEAIKYLNQFMEQLIEQTEFAVLSKYKKEMDKALKVIRGLNKDINMSYAIVSDRTKGFSQFRIDEISFNNCLYLMKETKRQVNQYLYKSGIIFRNEEGIDPDDLMKKIEEDYVNQGG